MENNHADAKSDGQKEFSEPDMIAIREECRKRLEQRFSKPPSGEMMTALFDAVLEDMVEKEML